MVGWSVPANRANGARTAARAEVRPHIAVFGAERRGHRLRRFIAALGRHRPLLVLGLGAEDDDDDSTPEHVLVVYRGTLTWETVDKLSDGLVQAALYTEHELAEELSQPLSLLADVLTHGPLLYGEPELRIRLLQQAGLAVPEATAEPTT